MKKSKRNYPQSFKKENNFFNKIIEYGLLGIIIFSPLPAASVNEWSLLVIQLTTLVMMTAYIMMKVKPRMNQEFSRSMKWLKYFFCGFFLWIFIQIIPLPKGLIKFFSPHTYSLYQSFSPYFSKLKFISFSLIPSHTFKTALELLSYFLIGFLIIKTVRRRQQIKRIFYLLVLMGIFEAFYGLYELYNKNPRILFYRKMFNLDSVTGTFVNRNHLSGYLELIIPLTIGLVISRIDFFSLFRMHWKERISHISGKGFSINFLLTLAIVIMSIAIVLSKSRSGVFLLIFAFILFLEFTFFYFVRLKLRRIEVRRFIYFILAVITFLSFYIGVGATVERFILDNLLLDGRPLYWSNVTRMIVDFPLMGTGLGTFGAIYPSYELIAMGGRLIHAHNDYLEYFSELGLGGIIFLFGGIIFITGSSFLVWRKRENPEVKGLGLGGIIAIFVMMAHSMSDFNLHVPANILLFSIVVSLTFVITHYKKTESSGDSLHREETI